MNVPDVVEARDLGVALGGRPVLRHLDLSVSPGEVVALLGPNGSGKSTLVKTMVGLHRATAGEVRLFGTPTEDFRDWARIGYVPQRSDVARGVPATVAEIVASGRLSRRRPLLPARRADRVAVRRALEAVGLADRAHHQLGTLSGGQQRRVLVARTLAGEPEVLFLDEPLAGVDLLSQQALAGTLARLVADGATVVVVLHEIGPLAELVQRSVVLREGRIVYDGSAAALAALEPGQVPHPPRPAAPVVSPPMAAPLEGDS